MNQKKKHFFKGMWKKVLELLFDWNLAVKQIWIIRKPRSILKTFRPQVVKKETPVLEADFCFHKSRPFHKFKAI